ncbi:MAG TPA: ATP-binding protein [Terriglobales bacterium]|nr:ATP-binding protein [Terriglobales bacterium]
MELTELYVRLELLLTIFMVVLLWSLYFRLRRHQFFRWWAWAWTCFAVFLIVRAALLHLPPTWTLMSAGLWLMVLIFGFLQPPLLVLGAWSVPHDRVPGRRLVGLSLGLAIGAAVLFFAVSLSWGEQTDASVAVRFIPRMLCLTAALFFCSYVFARRWSQRRSLASATIAAFCLVGAIDRTSYIWIYVHRLLLQVSTPPTLQAFGAMLTGHPLLYFLDISCLCGICLGMVLLVVEEHERAEDALWASDSRSREIAANNAALEAEVLERRRVETALRESEDRYRDLVENSKDLLCTHDLQGRLLSANPAPARALGYTVEELLRIPMREIIAPEYREAFDEYLLQIQKEGASNGYMRVLTRTGERRIWEYHNTLRTEGVPAPIVRGLAHDVTERMLAEQALRQSEQRLRQVQKMEAVGRLAGGIAHDFNNFLLGITLNIEQALRQLGPKDYSLMDYLDQALNAALSAASVTRRLLTFSRRQGFLPQSVNLNDVVITAKDLLDRMGGENIYVELKLQNDLGRVRSDPVQLQQVILNLLLNARDAMPLGGQITIRTENFDLKEIPGAERFSSIPRPGLYVVLEVTDSGAGMDEETVCHLFEPFFTTKQTTTAAGMGLPVCYGIVTQSDGHISVRSRPGSGTTVRVYLPLLQGRSQEAMPASAALPSPDFIHPHLARTVLVVDDTDVVRIAVARDLRGVGYSVLAASSPTEALLLSDQHKGPIHLLVADVVMPGMNGRELARHLLRTRPDLKVLFMTGYDKDSIALEGPVDASETLLYKPFSSLELFAALGKLLDKEAA